MNGMFRAIASAVAFSVASAWAQEEIVIKALVDGPSEFVVTTNGFQWKNGMNAKPGKHEGRNEPTYINDTAWYPRWKKPDEERGTDASEIYPFAAVPDMEFELLAIGDDPSVTSVEPRTLPAAGYNGSAMVISFPDPESGSKWYVFALTRTPSVHPPGN